MKALRDQLGGGDRRSKGTADAIAAEALDDPPLVAALVAALDDPAVAASGSGSGAWEGG